MIINESYCLFKCSAGIIVKPTNALTHSLLTNLIILQKTTLAMPPSEAQCRPCPLRETHKRSPIISHCIPWIHNWIRMANRLPIVIPLLSTVMPISTPQLDSPGKIRQNKLFPAIVAISKLLPAGNPSNYKEISLNLRRLDIKILYLVVSSAAVNREII